MKSMLPILMSLGQTTLEPTKLELTSQWSWLQEHICSSKHLVSGFFAFLLISECLSQCQLAEILSFLLLTFIQSSRSFCRGTIPFKD